MSRLIVLERRDFRRRYPGAAGIFDPEDFPGCAVVPRGMSTRVRLHELGHGKLGHTRQDIINGMDLDEYIDREVAADAYANGILRREFTSGALNNIIEQAIDAMEGPPNPNYCVLKAFSSLEKRHIKVSSSWRNQVRRGVKRVFG